MKNFLPIFALLLSGCADFGVTATMKKPVDSEKLMYEDDEIGVVFKLELTGINFILMNKSNRAIKVIWDDVSFTKNGVAKKAMHKGVKFIDGEKAQVPSTVPSGTILEEFVMMSENAKYINGRDGGMWLGLPIFTVPEKEAEFGLLLPIEVNGEVREYFFIFDAKLVRIKYKGNKGYIDESF